MNHYGTLTNRDREILTRTAETIAILRIPGCHELAVRLLSLSCSDRIDHTSVPDTIALADKVHRSLLAQASPDHWADDIASMNLSQAEASALAADLVEVRVGQAALVQTASEILQHLRPVLAGVS